MNHVYSAAAESQLFALKSERSETYLRKGGQVIKTNLDQAIAFFQRSLFYDDANLRARRQLKLATTMRENLRKIQLQQ